MAADDAEERWEGKASAKLTGCSADQIWPLLEDFFNVHKIIPEIVDTCYGIQGISGQPGCIRYCSKTSSSEDGSGEMVIWANEKLLSIDPIRKCLGYKLMENNLGFDSHMATIKLLPPEQDDGCEIIWSFGLKPIQGSSLDNIVSIYDSAVKNMKAQIENIFQVKKQ